MGNLNLTPQQLERYSRHLRLKEVGPAGQAKLLDARVLIVGLGGLGAPVALYLAAAGVGTLGLLDDDRVSLSNLQRQVLYTQDDVGQPKVEAARRRLQAMNSDLRVILHPVRLTAANAEEIVQAYDVVVGGADNFPTRYLLSDACTLLGKPLVDGSVLGFTGQVTTFLPGQGCYRCLFPSPPPPGAVPNCAEAGVLGAMVGQVGTLQAMEALKLVLGLGEPLSGRLLIFDALAGDVQEIHWSRDPHCPACGSHPTVTELAAVDYPAFCGILAESPAEGVPAASGAIGAENGAGPGEERPVRLEGRLDVTPREAYRLVQEERVDLIDVREPWEYAMYHAEGAALIPLSQFQRRADELNPARDLLVVCEHGRRSLTVVEALRRQGLGRVYNVAGGMSAWLAQDLPVKRGADR